MKVDTKRQMSQDALAELRDADDARFWELAASYGYRRPEAIDPGQAWFWTRRWITKELEADLDEAEGRMTYHDSDEEFLAALERADADADPRGG